MTNVVAIDMGSSSIRAYIGQWDDDKKELHSEEVYRQSHQVKTIDDYLTWDVGNLLTAATQACEAATDYLGCAPDSVAVDGWGVDYVPVDADGIQSGYAIAYRDPVGTDGAALVHKTISKAESFQLSGVAPQDINSVNRWALHGHGIVPLSSQTSSLMFLQDVVARHLATVPINGWEAGKDPGPWASAGIASTSGAASRDHCQWNSELLAATKLKTGYVPQIESELSCIGQRGRTHIIRAGSHDTACAAYSLGAELGDVFVSCGSWAVVGVVTKDALVTDDAYRAGVTNEASVDGFNRAQLNLTGMWLAQECRRVWQTEGIDTRYSTLDRLTRQASSFNFVIDPQDPQLNLPGQMPQRIANLVKRDHGDTAAQQVKEPGAMLRLLDDSVAHSIADGIGKLQSLTHTSGRVFLMGGAVNDPYLVQKIADELGRDIVVASDEATVYGSIGAQLKVITQTRWTQDDTMMRIVQPRPQK